MELRKLLLCAMVVPLMACLQEVETCTDPLAAIEQNTIALCAVNFSGDTLLTACKTGQQPNAYLIKNSVRVTKVNF